ncbi:MAG: exodeoxyribonuclease VII large subunit [Bacteroidales bacterium]|nr:exodeoxyribonuclease VII large subunit [Bacteroidales bacterium]
MPEKISDRTIFSLSEVAGSIQKTLSERYTTSFWIKAEMNKLNHYPQSGHCYPDLVEKTAGKIVAEMRSTIWKDDFQRINDHFVNVLHEPLKNGIKILFSAKISYHPVFGLSLRILDIDPAWSLGELEKEKLQTIEKIRKEGLFNANRSLMLPLLPQRIAVISVETSKGYADFRKIIDDNEWGYSIFHMLFPALLQGEKAVPSIVGQMERIMQVKHHFDAVAIIRGGGGDIGLACYNNYELAKAIALFPIPVITGIGHSTNETVAEMVAFRNAITPTEMADFLIQKFHNFSVPLKKMQETIINKLTRLLRDEKSGILNTTRYFKSVTLSRLAQRRNMIQQEVKAVNLQSTWFLNRKQEMILNAKIDLFDKSVRFMQYQLKEICSMQKNIELMDPVNVLNRGYSITLVNDKAVRSVCEVGTGTMLKTILADGNILSTTLSVYNNETDD